MTFMTSYPRVYADLAVSFSTCHFLFDGAGILLASYTLDCALFFKIVAGAHPRLNIDEELSRSSLDKVYINL